MFPKVLNGTYASPVTLMPVATGYSTCPYFVLSDRGFDVIALPMKIAGGTGGPLRIIAVVPPSR